MKLENQVCSLELAQKLKNLKIDQESYFYCYQTYKGLWALGDTTEMLNHAVDLGSMTAPQFNTACAFTVAELGEMLPPHWKLLRGAHYHYCEWWIGEPGPMRPGSVTRFHREDAHTEADARAKMLIYLLENKIISSEVARCLD
jgi:hypothetical protein